jgi:tRNA threonylcarbamoyladenosine biosynthesis protein TsaB
MVILNIETSTNCCSVAITIDGEVVAMAANLDGANHASELPVYIEQVMKKAKENDWKLDAVALSQGPGSYTGLRIGCSTAKGLCYGLNIPMIPVDTLQIIGAAALAKSKEKITSDGMLCPLLDARRMEVYTSIYTHECVRVGEIEAKIVDEASWNEELKKGKLYFMGNGAEKCKNVVTSANAVFIDGIVPEAQYMGRLAERGELLDVKTLAYYEPFYLKEFVAAPSHIKGLESK